MPITPPPPPASRLSLLKGFLSIFLPLCLVMVMVGAMHYYTVYTTEQAAREAKEALNVDLARRMIANDIAGVVSDLMFLSEHIELQGLFELDPAARKERIAQEFLVFARKKGLYDQIRYLDSSGMEVIRVNFRNNSPGVVPKQALQNKFNRYYFREALALNTGGIYLSPLDLNIEEERIEIPYKPMMRFGTPLFDSAGEKRGIVLLNYFGSRLIDNFTWAAANIADHVQLINQQGYWLSSPNREEEWGFMFGRSTRFKERFPDAWSEITKQDAGQFQTESGMHTFATIYPLAVALKATGPLMGIPDNGDVEERFWKIVSIVSAKDRVRGGRSLRLPTEPCVRVRTRLLTQAVPTDEAQTNAVTVCSNEWPAPFPR